MRYLETFLNKYYGETISNNIYLNYDIFDYSDKSVFIEDINFLASNIYNIKIVNTHNKNNKEIIFNQKFIYHLENGDCVINPETNIIILNTKLDNTNDIKYLLSIELDENINYEKYIQLLYYYKLFLENSN